MTPPRSYSGLNAIAAIVVGESLHPCVSAEFRWAESPAFRLEAAARLAIGSAIYYLARRLRPAA